ncbi:hypothetical protein [Guptibacillus hwajinpoensis]|uniref:hypothetical protein n=1 Tax=Guptibacillus hwajinpoensis TaxID=208199 RepID=UPI003D019707
MQKKSVYLLVISIFVFSVFIYYIYGQEYRYAKKIANNLFELSIPEKTVLLEKGYDYGQFYGGGPTGNGGYPTVVVYMKISSSLSEQEIFDYYNQDDIEVYFDWWVEEERGKEWYEGIKPKPQKLSDKENINKTIKVVIQKRSLLVTPYGEVVY